MRPRIKESVKLFPRKQKLPQRDGRCGLVSRVGHEEREAVGGDVSENGKFAAARGKG